MNTDMKHDTSNQPAVAIGDRIRWSEPLTARRHSHDTDPREGEGVVIAVYHYADGRLQGVTVAYHPSHNPTFTAKAYYTAGWTRFEVIA